MSGPAISPASPVFGQAVTASYSCSDGGSGVVSCGPSGSATFPPTSNTGTLTSAVAGSVGMHSFTVNSQDLVGNSAAAATVNYTVAKATPILTWPTPAPITYGTPLSSTQLDATANVPGTFIYTPVLGTILGGGNQTLSVTFNPTDNIDYNSVTTQVTLVVMEGALSFSPSSLNFGSVKLGKLVYQTVLLTNTGNSTLNISNVSASGSDPDDFTPVSTCFFPLSPGGQCYVFVFFYADDVGTRTGTLSVTDNGVGSPQNVSLTGTVTKK